MRSPPKHDLDEKTARSRIRVLAVLKAIAVLGGRLGLNVRDSNLSIVVAPHGHFDGLRQNVGVAV